MKSKDFIIKQLKEQGIEFNILQEAYNPDSKSLVSKTIEKWKEKFVINKKTPYLDSYLWHVFSFKTTNSIEGEKATREYLNQWKTNILIFNESKDYLIECINSIPEIKMIDFIDDIYISHSNMKWTYVIPHEISTMGPYFSIRKPNKKNYYSI